MSKRGLMVLIVGVAVLILLAVFGQRGNDTTSSSQGALLIPDLEAALNDVERITLVKAGREPVATLERRPDTWVVVEKSGYRADVAKIRQNFIALAEARILEQKTANPQLYDRLGVEDIDGDTAVGIAISLAAGGRELPTLILGNAEGTKYRYARRAGEAQSYLIDRDPDLPRNASQWVDANIIDVRGQRVQQVTISHPDGEIVSISKPEPAATAELAGLGVEMNFEVANVPAGRELLYAGVANVIGNALRELSLEDVEPVDANADAADQQQAQEKVVVEFRTFDGLVVRAHGTEQAEGAWVRFEASFSAEQAAQFAAVAPAASDVSSDEAPTSDPEIDEDGADNSAISASAEAQRINQRVTGWRYRIAGYQYDQMTRRMTDLLKPAA